jgi:hypothetical protein
MNPSMPHSRIAPLVIAFVLLAQASLAAPPPTPVASPAAAVPVCNGKYKDGLTPSDAELKETLKQHGAWLNDVRTLSGKPGLANDPRIANLCGANLSKRLAGYEL